MTKELSGTPTSFSFPKTARILRTSDFRRAYNQGRRFAGAYFAAFCLELPRGAGEGPRLGFTIPRKFGNAPKRNRMKRRFREVLRLRLAEFAPAWDIVINPRREAWTASPAELQRAVDRLVAQCAKQ